MTQRWWYAATAVVPALFALATVVLQRASGVVMFDDELGFLGEAVLFSTREGEALLRGIPFYSAGYPLLLSVPLSVLPFDPWTVAVAGNVVLLAALGPVLLWLVRRVLAVPPPQAALAAIAGATVPSVVLQTPRAWSEVCFAVAFAVWAALLHRYGRLGPGRGAVPLAVSAGVLLSIHRRATAVVLVTLAVIALWSLAGALRRGGGGFRAVPWRTLALAEAAGVATALGALRLDAHVVDRLYDGTTSGSRLDKADNLTSTEWIPTLLGHVWSVLATTFGLAAVGSVLLVWLLWRRQQLVFSGTLALAVAGVGMTSVVFLANGVRADQLVYERYVAPVTPVLVALGVAAVAGALGRWRSWSAGAGFALVAAGGILSISLDESRLTGNVQKMTVPTLVGLDVPAVGWAEPFVDRIHVLPVTAVAGVGVVLAVVAARAGRYGVIGVPALWAVVVAVASAGSLAPFLDLWERTGREAAAVLRDHDVAVLQYGPHLRHESRNVLHYRLDYLDAVPADPPSCEVSPFVVGPPELEAAIDGVPLVPVGNFPGIVYELDC